MAAYLAAYWIASYLDLATTALAVQMPDVHERNIFAVNANGFATSKAWLTTAAGAIIMTGCVIFSFRRAADISEIWLRHPIRSFGKFYVNPWSANVRDRSPIHMLSFALAFVVLRVLAATNNLLLCEQRFAPLGALVGAVGARTSPLIGFVVPIVIVFYMIAILVSPIAATVLDRSRKT